MIENFIMVKPVKWLLSFVLSIITIVWANASHLRAGEITVERADGCSSRKLKITITVYTNTASEVKFGEDGILYFGDGTKRTIPRVENIPQPHLGPNIGMAQWVEYHTYGSNASYLISYVEPNRNGGVLNMSNSFYTTFYLETRFSLAVLGCNNSPRLKIPPIDQACTGQAFYHNPGAYDINGPNSPIDSISYEEVVPYRDRGLPVDGYQRPNEIGNGESEAGGAATYTINSIDGTMIWDAPGTPGEYNVAFNVVEWRKIEGIWQRIGWVRRDMQIIVSGDCKNERPFLIMPADTCVIAGAHINKDITGYDRNKPQRFKLRLQAYSEVLEFTQSPARIIGDTTTYQFPADSTRTITFDWNTVCEHIKGQAYDVVFKVTNDPKPWPATPPPDPHIPPNLATFASWRIAVIPPAPVLTTTVPNAQRNVQLTWANYDCASITDKAKYMQIWRRVDEYNFIPGNCDTGMPESLGYSLIATTPLTNTQYLDTNNGLGLERGVKYCYRLVAVFGDRGSESYVSNEVCIDPMDIAAPLITKVTVDKTSESNGEITVSWLPPINNFEVRNNVPFEDYEYQVERAGEDGFSPVSPKIAGTPDSTAVMSFMDAGLNTLDRQYIYRVMLYVTGNTEPVDSSSVASSVRLTLTTSDGVINLSWRASVPWSNQIQGLVHDIYRMQGITSAETLSELQFYKSVDATAEGLQYSDVGLTATDSYCYAVITRGSYGNDSPTVLAVEPLVNASQINCAMPVVVLPPCAPVITAFADPCDDYFVNYNCNTALFSTVVRWSMPEDCPDEIIAYEVYQASTSDDEPDDDDDPIAVVTDTFAIIQDQSSLAYCYWIKAINRSNAKSNFSKRVCSENCPNYELPNVFTPNGDLCNDTFSAFGVVIDLPEDFETCTPADPNDPRCARFVDRVDFKVFNRWGKKIYEYVGQRENENTIYIQWNGKDSSGKDLASGIYFYAADVTFESTKRGGTVKTIKGWVHLIR